MPGLPKSYIKKYGVSKKAWRMYRASKNKRKSRPKTTKRSVKRTARRRSYRKTRRRSSNKWGVAGTVLKLAVGAYLGNMAGGYIAKYTNNQGPLFRAGGSVVGAIAAKKLLGKVNPTVATGAAAVLAGGAAVDFMAYMKSRGNGNGA